MKTRDEMSLLHKSVKSLCWSMMALLAMASSSVYAATIVGSKHDLSPLTVNTDQVCVFCHTPHGSDNTAPVPLWNKNLPTGTVYTRYSSLNVSTFDGTEAPINGGISIACLSCHDGAQAMDTVLNAPGSGGYNGAGSPIDGAIGSMPGDGIPLSLPIPNLGTDLSDDHPIAVQYAGGGCSDTVTTCTTLGDPDFNTPDYGTASNGTDMWWFDTSADGIRNKDEVQLYTRGDLVAAAEPSVECASCHDVHEGASKPDVQFMRVSTAASLICTTCHVK